MQGAALALLHDKVILFCKHVVCVFMLTGTKRIRTVLRREAVPSVFPWTKQKSASQARRDQRQLEKAALATEIAADEWERKMEEVNMNKVYAEWEVPMCNEVNLISEDVACSESDVVSVAGDSDSPCECDLDSNNTNELNVNTEKVACSDTESNVFSVAYQCQCSVACQCQCNLPPNKTGAICTQDEAVMVQIKEPYLSVDVIKDSDKLVLFYTGLENFDVFMHAFWSLGDSVDHLKYAYSCGCKCLSSQNQFLLMLVKLRRYYPHFELARMFQVSDFTVQNIFVTWVNFCYFQWKEVDWWPNRDLVSHHCPTDFKRKFPTTRVIVDGTEVRVKRPSNPKAQSTSFSSYKHGNTMKVLVGVTPGGLTSFVSEAYGGSSSDRQLVERTTLTTLCDPKDSIMADKGFNVQDIFAVRDVQINIPAFFKKNNKLSPETRQKDRKIASKRVHVERVIGMAKVYTICQHRLNVLETKLATQIINVCFMLCNFRRTIIGRFA